MGAVLLWPAGLLAAALLVAGGCAAPPVPAGRLSPPPAVSPEEPFRLTGWPAGAEAVVLRYRANGSPWTEVSFGRPAPAVPPVVAAEPDYPRSWPAVLLDWAWQARFPDGSTRTLGAGSLVRPGLLTAVAWQVQRDDRVLLFTAAGGPPVPSAATLSQEYWRLAQSFLEQPEQAPPQVSLYVFPTTAEFGRFSGAARMAAGVAEVNLARAYVDNVGEPAALHQVLVHELAHLVAGEFTLRWFTEGVAGLAEAPYHPAGHLEAALNRAGLRISQRSGRVDLGTASGADLYDLGYLFLKYLQDRYGAGTLRRLIAAARAHQGDVEAAMVRVLGRDRRALEAEFARAVLDRLTGDHRPWRGEAPPAGPPDP